MLKYAGKSVEVGYDTGVKLIKLKLKVSLIVKASKLTATKAEVNPV